MRSLNHNPINRVYKKSVHLKNNSIISEFGNLRPFSLVRSLYGEWRTSLTDLPNKTEEKRLVDYLCRAQPKFAGEIPWNFPHMIVNEFQVITEDTCTFQNPCPLFYCFRIIKCPLFVPEPIVFEKQILKKYDCVRVRNYAPTSDKQLLNEMHSDIVFSSAFWTM